MQRINVSSSYLEKQRNFRSLVKEIQINLNSKEYLKQGYSFNDYVKMKWNISQAQAYRYIMCAKVLDQLEEFEIQPSYERVCHALHHTVKNTSQMKLLWSVILQKAGMVPESINSTHIKKIWKEICMDEKYSHICQNKESITKKIENSINKLSVKKMHNQMNQMNQMSQMKSAKSIPVTQPVNMTNIIPSPVLSETSYGSNPTTENTQFYNNINNINSINIPLSPEYLNDYNSVSYENINSMSLYNSVPTTSVESLYYVLPSNEVQYQPQQIIYQQPIVNY